MTEPTRDNFMEALRDVSGFTAPLMLEGTAVDTTEDGQPAVSTVSCRSTTARATPPPRAGTSDLSSHDA